MDYLADTANIDEIKELLYYYPIKGVTTNPTILSHENKVLSTIIPEILQCIGDNMLHLQMINENSNDILIEAKRYRDYFQLKDNYYVKIPVTREGYRAMRLVKEAGMKVTATAIFTQQQALLAAKAGADYVAPYVNRLDNISSHGIDVVADIAEAFRLYNLPCKVLGASFKNVDQIYRVSMVGCHAVTASYEVLTAIMRHPMTDSGVMDFKKDGADVYDISLNTD